MRWIKRSICFIVILSCVLLLGNDSIDKDVYINSILSTTYYSSLPDSAKEFIRDAYLDTGSVVKVSDNKEENMPYLNPNYISYLSLSDEEKSNVEVIPNVYKVDYSSYIDTDIDEETLPSSYDSRNVNGNSYVSPNRDQGNLGLCWAFATSETAESYIMKTTNSPYNASSSLLIAERQIDYATASSAIKNYTSPFISFSRSIGSGGSFYVASYPLAAGVSLYSSNNFKDYDDSDTNSMEMSEVLTIADSEYELNSSIDSLDHTSTSVNTSFNNTVKQNIMNYGGVYVSIHWNSKCISTHNGNYLIDVNNCTTSSSDGHALEIIGWDDNYSYEYCYSSNYHYPSSGSCGNKVTGTGVWILKNSWGEIYSYPLLTYNSYDYSVSVITDLTKTSERNWDNNYSVGSASYYELSSLSINMSSTNIKGEEELKKIKFNAYSASSSYTINILQSNGDTTSVNASATYPGLVTVDIPDGVIVNSSSTITINVNSGSLTKKVLIFTKNVDTTPYVSLPSFGTSLSVTNKTMYSITKNIDSGTMLQYKLLTSEGVDVSSYITITNNRVAHNNVNTYFSISTTNMSSDAYKLVAIYNDQIIASTDINYYKFTGNGTSSNPYLIHNPFEFGYMYSNTNYYYKLSNDIDFTYATTNSNGIYYNDGYGFKGISNFSGSLDGNGYTISGLYQNNYIDSSHTRSTSNGLFYSLHGNATIKNLTLEDYNISCSSGYCGTIFSTYIGAGGSGNTITISNVALKNGKLSALDTENETYVGGVYGVINDLSGYAFISGIYNDSYIKNISGGGSGYFSYEISSGTTNPSINISDIELLGDIYSVNSSLFNAFDYVTKTNQTINVSNVLSTLNNDSFGLFTSTSDNSTFNITNTNIITNNNDNYLDNLPDVDSIKSFNANDLSDLIDSNSYSTWSNFSTNWSLKTINNIDRLPILSFVDFDYTSVSDAQVCTIDTEYTSIYSLINTDNVSGKRIIYGNYDNTIINIDSDGNIIPLGYGITNVNVKNLYDGFIGNITVSVSGNYATVTFYSNNDDNTTITQKVLVDISTKLKKNTFTMTSYTFDRWNTKNDGTGTNYTNEQIVSLNSDLELYAMWIPVYANITFYSNNDKNESFTQDVIIYTNTKLKKNTFTMTSYTFGKWNTEEDGSGTSYNDEEIINIGEDLELYAIWNPIYINVIFYSNNGKDESITQNVIIYTNTKLSKNTFTYKSYSFDKWNTKEDGSGTSYSNEEIVNLSDDLELYAMWNPVYVSITFYSNNEEDESVTQDVIIYTDIALSKNTFTYTSHAFEKWNTKEDGSGKSYNDEEIVNLSEDLELYAIWSTAYVTITFYSNNDANNSKIQNVVKDCVTKLDSNAFLYDNYTFEKWNTNIDGSGTSYSDEELVSLNNDLVLYAIWKPIYVTITFYSNNESKTQSIKKNSSTKLSKNTFVNDGYHFDKWNTSSDNSGISYNDESDIIISDNIVLYAIWVEDFSYVLSGISNDEENNIIYDLHVNTSFESLLSSISLNKNYSINKESSYDIVNTSGKINILKDNNIFKSYTLVVLGDINGDAKVSSADYVKVRKHIMGSEVISDLVLFKAADVNKDSKISSADYVKIRKYIMNGEGL